MQRQKILEGIILSNFLRCLAVFAVMALPVFENPGGLGRHAVDAPVGAAVTVADGDGEPTEVAPHHLDQLTGLLLARDRHVLTFAAVACLVASAIWRQT